MTLPTITATGRLTADPELRFAPSGVAVASFSIACNDRRKNTQTGEWEDGDATFLNCSAWRTLAEQIAETLTKGDGVTITGRLKQRSYDAKDGTRRTVYEVDIDAIGRGLWTRTGRPTAQQADPWAGQAQQPVTDPWDQQRPVDKPPF